MSGSSGPPCTFPLFMFNETIQSWLPTIWRKSKIKILFSPCNGNPCRIIFSKFYVTKRTPPCSVDFSKSCLSNSTPVLDFVHAIGSSHNVFRFYPTSKWLIDDDFFSSQICPIHSIDFLLCSEVENAPFCS